MLPVTNNTAALDLLRRIVVDGVRKESPDLTARQMAVLLTIYVSSPPHTVRGLAATLNVTKPAITRALDRLTELDLVLRQRDESNRRSVLVQRTVPGSMYMTELAEQILNASQQVGQSNQPAANYQLREAA